MGRCGHENGSACLNDSTTWKGLDTSSDWAVGLDAAFGHCSLLTVYKSMLLGRDKALGDVV